jgi:hypothetical protein
MFVFQSLAEVREQTALWLKEYNEEQPQQSTKSLAFESFCVQNLSDLVSLPVSCQVDVTIFDICD